jgi:hypothetical protein
MAITLELKPDVEALLVSQAHANGLGVDEYIEKLLEERKPACSPKSESPDDGFERLMRIVKKFDELPRLDHRSADEIIGYDEFGLPT